MSSPWFASVVGNLGRGKREKQSCLPGPRQPCTTSPTRPAGVECGLARSAVRSNPAVRLRFRTRTSNAGRHSVDETVVRTEELPRGERFEVWHEMTKNSLLATDIYSDAADFQATARVRGFSDLTVADMVFSPLRSRRTARMIRQADPEVFQLSLVRRGKCILETADRRAGATDAEIIALSSSIPFQGYAHGDPDLISDVALVVPRRALPLPADRLATLTGVRLPAVDGLGKLTTRYARNLAEVDFLHHPAEADRLAGIALDLLTMWWAQLLDVTGRVPVESRRQALLARIDAFIQQRLGDPDLTPGMIAAAHHISVRQLHRLHSDLGVGVAASIRRDRLERCRRDLADPALVARPVGTIARRWGFTDKAHFSRAFRAAYGIPPRDYRVLSALDRAESQHPCAAGQRQVARPTANLAATAREGEG
ncbi:helix-turn-helix domain-containing protein [Saccharothrix obliqua]|uniref:helix-turn-helix domain-containing protein n=1 Tax=Saccharothrix obliqua TaxID=2861747 RepID=UPI001C5D7C4E|nr:helix-turn-helix domain-containing protein [Saccharothrix obliqua]MBW4718109.1 helix-turn-helix domain-containing protein [Saccharothrix obliqua]